MRKLSAVLFALLTVASQAASAAAPGLNVGSKRFTESYILGEIIRQTAVQAGEAPAVHQRGLGNTAIVLGALTSGNIDIYGEYTGTIAREILKLDAVPPLAELNAKLAAMGLAASFPLGFNNTYALAVRGEVARAKGLAKLSDLKAHPELRLGLSQEFIGRADGWPGLQRAYELPFGSPRGLDHGLAYDAVAQDQVDVIDIYSTDAKLDKYGLVVLADDRAYFPRYDAVLLHRQELPARLPRTWAALSKLQGAIDDAAMRRMNAAAELEGKDFAAVAADFLAARSTAGSTAAGATAGASPAAAPGGAASTTTARPASAATATPFLEKLFGADFGRLLMQHLALVFVSLAASVAIGVPLGVMAARRPGAGRFILGGVGVVQTIPALALLAFLIPLTGRIGWVPAFIALALYALLPIVRNAWTGMKQIPEAMRDAAKALNLDASMILRRIELPLALPTIMAGIRTSAVINVGTATIAAFIGAGGFGERIVTGLALNDNATLLAGAIPTAVLALLIEGGFGWLERRLVPVGSRP